MIVLLLFIVLLVLALFYMRPKFGSGEESVTRLHKYGNDSGEIYNFMQEYFESSGDLRGIEAAIDSNIADRSDKPEMIKKINDVLKDLEFSDTRYDKLAQLRGRILE